MKKKKFVVDTSVIVKWFSQDNEGYTKQADAILQDVRDEVIELFAPELSKYEMGNVLLKGKNLTFSEAKDALDTFYQLPITFLPETQDLAEESYRIGSEWSISYYDASCIALQDMLDATLVTDNIKHQGKFPKEKIISLKDYR